MSPKPRPTVLDEIEAATRRRTEAAKLQLSPEKMRARALGMPPTRDFVAALRRPGWQVIAEVKLASPSEGDLAPGADPVAVAKAYEAAGAAAVSVLTEPQWFKGSFEYLSAVRKAVQLPLLMKDFVLEPYQLWQGRAAGADAALLIAALLDAGQLGDLIKTALGLGLAPLVEVHSAEELAAALRVGARLVGVNNRDLHSLKTELAVSRRLAPLARMPGITLVSESGISRREQITELAGLGYKAFLLGTHFMKSPEPGAALAALLEEPA